MLLVNRAPQSVPKGYDIRFKENSLQKEENHGNESI